jgi:hypothetical protein
MSFKDYLTLHEYSCQCREEFDHSRAEVRQYIPLTSKKALYKTALASSEEGATFLLGEVRGILQLVI